jgi:hypothetical protein
MGGYLVYRRRLGLNPRAQARIGRPERLVEFRELSYASAVVPIFGTDVSARALRAAARLVGPDAKVDALFVLRVPPQLSLDAGLDAEEHAARNVLEAARLAGRRAGVDVRTSLVRTRHPGRAIVDEARRLEADLVYLDAVHAPASERVFGPIASFVLAHRPCRVVVEVEPAGLKTGVGEKVQEHGTPTAQLAHMHGSADG